MSIPFISAEEAASIIQNGDNLGFSGFTASGTPKVVTVALAERAKELHAKGEPFKVNLYTGASTNDHVDGELARAEAVGVRTPYQGHPDARKLANAQKMNYFDAHLSHVSQDLRYGFYGDIDVAVIEATEMSPSGEIILGAGMGMTPTIAQMAKKIIIEYSSYYRTSFRGFHDNYVLADPPHRREIPIYKPNDRIGSTVLKIDRCQGIVLGALAVSVFVQMLHGFQRQFSVVDHRFRHRRHRLASGNFLLQLLFRHFFIQQPLQSLKQIIVQIT